MHVEEQFTIVGVSGALTFSALSGLLLHRLLPYQGAALPPGHRSICSGAKVSPRGVQAAAALAGDLDLLEPVGPRATAGAEITIPVTRSCDVAPPTPRLASWISPECLRAPRTGSPS